MVLSEPLMYSQLSFVIPALHNTTQVVKDIHLLSPNDFLVVLGSHYLKQHLNFLLDLQVVLTFIYQVVHLPGSYNLTKYLELRE